MKVKLKNPTGKLAECAGRSAVFAIRRAYKHSNEPGPSDSLVLTIADQAESAFYEALEDEGIKVTP